MGGQICPPPVCLGLSFDKIFPTEKTKVRGKNYNTNVSNTYRSDYYYVHENITFLLLKIY